MGKVSPETLDEIVDRLVEALHPVRVYLFGSQARGDSETDSDIDLLVVVDETDVPTRQLTRRGRRSLWGMAVPVDLMVCTTADMETWSNEPSHLLYTVAREGRVVYAA